MSDVLRLPGLVFSFGVEQLRRLPGARFVAPFTKWLARLLLLAALFLGLVWAAEASPQRMTLADLAAGRLSSLQSWVIVTGDLADEPGSSSTLHVYRLTDPAAPNAYLIVRSRVRQSLGHTTVSGRIEGGRDGVPPGYAWSARLNADARLAGELPPPWTAIALAAAGILIVAARRSSYPLFVSEPAADTMPATGAVHVRARSESGAFDRRTVPATLSFVSAEPGSADLSIDRARAIPVRLHSAFTRVDVGVLRRLTGTDPALRVRSEGDDLVLAFATRKDRDAASAALSAEGQELRLARTASFPLGSGVSR